MPKAVLTIKVDLSYDDLTEERYHFPRTYLLQVEAAVGDWVIYLELRRSSADFSSRGGRQAYFAAARVRSRAPDPAKNDHFYALTSDFLEFDRAMPFRESGRYPLCQGSVNDTHRCPVFVARQMSGSGCGLICFLVRRLGRAFLRPRAPFRVSGARSSGQGRRASAARRAWPCGPRARRCTGASRVGPCGCSRILCGRGEARDLARAAENRKRFIGILMDADVGAHEMAPVFMVRDLQHAPAIAHAIVGADDTILLHAQDFGEIAGERDEDIVVRARRDREASVEISDVGLGQPGIGGLDVVDPGEPQLLRQAPLQRAENTFHSSTRFGRLGWDVLDPQLHQRTPDLCQMSFIHAAAGRRGKEIMAAAIRVEA